MRFTLITTAFLALGCASVETDVRSGAPAVTNALSHYIGTWDLSGSQDGAPYVSGERTMQWVLGGQFVQTTGFVKTADGANDFEIVALMQFDAAADRYRTWSFLSNGMIIQSEMTWDAGTRTMTEITRYGSVTQTATSRFAEEGVEEWSMTNTDADGAIVSEARGTNRRRG